MSTRLSWALPLDLGITKRERLGLREGLARRGDEQRALLTYYFAVKSQLPETHSMGQVRSQPLWVFFSLFFLANLPICLTFILVKSAKEMVIL